jgi:formylglycine-generating enzyme required for sulfatase activity
MEFVWIRPGSFMMGSSHLEPGRGSYEGPKHRVEISSGFHLGRHEVTQAQWERVMGSRPWEGRDRVREGPDYPAVFVSWNDVEDFVARLNAGEQEPVYRLPTEAEWEYACRAGTTTAWSFGDETDRAPEYAWYSATAWGAGKRFAHEVGRKRPNPWGLFDMHGNAWEWVADGLRLYTGEGQADPVGPRSEGGTRVVRGGDYASLADLIRSPYRATNSPSTRNSSTGFRLVRQTR